MSRRQTIRDAYAQVKKAALVRRAPRSLYVSLPFQDVVIQWCRTDARKQPTSLFLYDILQFRYDSVDEERSCE